jgi:hypothetical protein
MAFHRSKDRAAVHGFVDALAEHRAAFGRFYVDPSIAALALEAVRADDAWHPGVAPVDAIIFHRGSWARDELMIDIAGNHLDTCTHVLRTGIVVCSRQPLPHDALAGLDTEAFSSDMAFGARPPPEPAAPPR